MLAESRPANPARSLQRVCAFVKVDRKGGGLGAEGGRRSAAFGRCRPSALPTPPSPLSSSFLAVFFSVFMLNQDPVDPLAVHIDHFQVQAVPLGLVADRWDVAEPVEDQAGNRAESAAFPGLIGAELKPVNHVGD